MNEKDTRISIDPETYEKLRAEITKEVLQQIRDSCSPLTVGR